MFIPYIFTGLLGLLLIYALYEVLRADTKEYRFIMIIVSLLLLVSNIAMWVLLVGYAK